MKKWNWKPIKVLQKDKEKKIRNPKNGDQIEEYNTW
jgi:hypothetical protein